MQIFYSFMYMLQDLLPAHIYTTSSDRRGGAGPMSPNRMFLIEVYILSILTHKEMENNIGNFLHNLFSFCYFVSI